MAKTGEILLGALSLVAAGVVFFNYKQEHLGQQSRNLRLKIVNVGMDGPEIILSVKVLNPNSQDMQVQSFVGEMYAGNRVVADISMFGDYIAKANNQITIPLIARPKMPNLWLMLVQLFKQGTARITFAGTINVNNQPMPISLSYTK